MTGRTTLMAASMMLAGAALVTGGAAHAAPPTSAPATSESAPAPACGVTAADVEGGTATFTVGPIGCEGTVGPISFSTYALPGGFRQPYEDQILIEHAADNGLRYGAGTYTLEASLGDACNWQSDLYRSPSDDQPPLIFLLAYDYVEGRTDCGYGPTTTSTTTAPTSTSTSTSTTSTSSTSTSTSSTTTSTTVAISVTSDVRPTTTDVTTTTGPTTSAGPTTSDGPTTTAGPSTTSGPTTTTAVGNAGGGTTTTQVQSATPTTVVGGAPGIRETTTSTTVAVSPISGSLPSTGSSLALGLAAIAAGAVALGTVLRRLASNPQR